MSAQAHARAFRLRFSALTNKLHVIYSNKFCSQTTIEGHVVIFSAMFINAKRQKCIGLLSATDS